MAGEDDATRLNDGPGGVLPPGWSGESNVLLHIGAPKTATTALQSCLAASRADLEAIGVVYPGTALNQVPAARFLLGWPATDERRVLDEKRWTALSRSVRRNAQPTIVSAESVGVADEATARAFVEGLGGDRVRIVLTLRSLALILPSAYQEDVKAGLGQSFDDWLAIVCEGPDGPAGGHHPFWVAHDHATVVERWSRVVGPERLAVVVLDPQDRSQVFRDVEALAGLPPGTLDPARADRGNRSLTAGECEVLRRLNIALGNEGVFSLRSRLVPPMAIAQLLDGRQPGPHERRLELTADQIDRIRPISQDAVRRIADAAAAGVAVRGDLAHLVPTPGDVRGDVASSSDPADDIPVDVAVALLAAVLRPRPAPADHPG